MVYNNAYFYKRYLSTIYQKQIEYLPKTEKPNVGYVVHAKGGLKNFLHPLWFLKREFGCFIGKNTSDYCKFYLSSHVRLKYLKIIQSSNEIILNFIYCYKLEKSLCGCKL